MAKKQSKKSADVVHVSKNWQLAFVVVVALGWLAPLGFMLSALLGGGYVGLSTWLFQGTGMLLPLLFFLAALAYVWRQQQTHLARLFVAGLLTFIAYGLFMVASGIDNIIRYRFFPPVISDLNDSSFLTAYGHDWLVMGIGLAVFLSVLAWLRGRQKA